MSLANYVIVSKDNDLEAGEPSPTGVEYITSYFPFEMSPQVRRWDLEGHVLRRNISRS